MTVQAVHETVKQIIADISGIPPARIPDTHSLFDLGFDSLMAVQLVLKIEEQLGVRLSIRDLFEHSCVKELVEILNLRKVAYDE